MKIRVNLHPGSSKEEIRKINEKELEIWIKEKPIDNRANIRLVKILKKYFDKEVKLVSGFTSRNKTIEVFD